MKLFLFIAFWREGACWGGGERWCRYSSELGMKIEDGEGGREKARKKCLVHDLLKEYGYGWLLIACERGSVYDESRGWIERKKEISSRDEWID